MAEPTVNPNTFGAPAEGFGQNVTFAFDPKGEVPQQKPITSSGPRVGVSGVSGVQRSDPRSAIPEPVQVDPTAALLMKVGGDILNRKMDEARTAQFVEGMQRAMSGEAIQEVKDSVPWYAKIFGDTPVIEGARAYGAQDTVNKTLAAQTASIKQIEGLDAPAASKHFASVMNSAMTGDPGSDALIIKQMAEQMPSLMKAQAKAHVAYNQRKAAQTMSESMRSGAALLQQAGESYAGDVIDDKAMEAQRSSFVKSMLPPAGIDEENYQKTVTANMLYMAQQGQFHAVEALKGAGILNALTDDQAKRVDAAMTAAATKARDNYAFKYSSTIAEIKSDAYHPPAGQTDQQLRERIDRANSAFKKLTGSPVGLFSSDQVSDMLTGHFNAFKAENTRVARANEVLARADAKAGEKAAAAAEVKQTVDTLVAGGEWNKARILDGVSNDMVDRSVYEQAKTLSEKDPSAAAEFLRKGFVAGNTSRLLADEMQRGMKLVEQQWANGVTAPPDEFFKAVDAYSALKQKGGLGFANAYFGEHAKTLAYALNMGAASQTNSAAVYAGAMTVGQRAGPELPKKEHDALVKRITSEGRDYTPAWMGGASLREDAIRRLTDINASKVAGWKAAGLSDEEAVVAALNDTLGPDTDGGRRGGSAGELIGGYFIERQPGSSQRTVFDIINDKNLKGQGVEVPAELRGEFFKTYLADELKVPKDSGTTQIVRQPDVAGTPQFVVMATQPDGSTVIRNFTGDSLQTFAADKTKWKRLGFSGSTRAPTAEENAAWNEDRKRREATPYTPIPLTFGPQINYRADNPYFEKARKAREEVKLTK